MAKRPAVARAIVLAGAFAVLAGCGGQSDQDRAAAVARAYDHAFVTQDGERLCALMTPSLRRRLSSAAGLRRPGGCIALVSFPGGTLSAASGVHPVVSAVRVSGSRATATIRTSAGVGLLPLVHEGEGWRVSGAVRYVTRVWVKADYRVRRPPGTRAASVADTLAQRASVIIGTPVEARAIGSDEISLAVAEPVKPSDLALVTQRASGRLALYDWEADAVTRDGRPVSDGFRRHDPGAVLISQGSERDPPGTGAGSMTRHDAVRLATRQHSPGWAVVRAWAPISGVGPDGPLYYVLRDRPELSRADITDAYAETDELGNPDIVLRFTPRGMRRFQRLTAVVAHRGATLRSPDLSTNQHIAVVLDGTLLTVLYVDFRVHPHGISAVEGAEITGGFSPATAWQLAAEISAPPLPADLELVDSTSVTRRGS
jgi:hypothetical protein